MIRQVRTVAKYFEDQTILLTKLLVHLLLEHPEDQAPALNLEGRMIRIILYYVEESGAFRLKYRK
jgi:hypothetical protein